MCLNAHLCISYRVFIKYSVFYLNFFDFLNSAKSATALVFYLRGVCTHTDTEGKQRGVRVRNILKSSGENTIFNKHLVTNPYIIPSLKVNSVHKVTIIRIRNCCAFV